MPITAAIVLLINTIKLLLYLKNINTKSPIH